MRAALAAAGFSVVAEESVVRRPRRRWTPLVKLLEARAPHLFVWQQYFAATRDDAG
jgi:hypothetical protein